MHKYRTKRQSNSAKRSQSTKDTRIQSAGIMLLCVSGVIILRLFMLMVIQHPVYTALAAGSHEVYTELFPERGSIFITDVRNDESYPVALNRDYYLVYVDTRLIPRDDVRDAIIQTIVETFEYDDVKKESLRVKVYKQNDPYEPIEDKVPEEIITMLREKDLPGVAFLRRSYRYYPEGPFASSILGFVGKTDDGSEIGRYGIEGRFEEVLRGEGGFYSGAKSATGLWISTAGRSLVHAEDGADVYLTIDHTIQYFACERLAEALKEYEATSASLVIMDPKTGAIRAMCSLPNFDPNTYNEVESIRQFNNSTIFRPYEIGSIFKPIVMAAAINDEVLTPNSLFYDSGSTEGLCQKPIRNADEKIYKDQTMTGVLENSINTGMVYTAEQLGKKRLISYIEDFGFGLKTGITLDTETSGTIDTLYINKGDAIDCYGATASFGQGITATPLQMVSAYSAIANGGLLMKPYIVDHIEYPSGKIDRTNTQVIKRVLSTRSASLVSGMLVSVVDSGHAGGAAAPGYYIAGKTGTAQISGVGGYTDETNHSFVGYGPVSDPKFVMLVKFEKPQRRFSASTAAPVFGDITAFLMQYHGIAPTR